MSAEQQTAIPNDVRDINFELYRRDQHDKGSYVWGRDYGHDLLRDLNKMAHTAGVGCLQRDLLQRAFAEIARLRKRIAEGASANE